MTETPTADTTPYEHGGVTWDIPNDLIALQQAWDDAHAAVGALVDGDDTEAFERARARRLDLTDALHDHPWLLAAMRDRRRFQADLALKACARQR